jgi:hypothetical protein
MELYGIFLKHFFSKLLSIHRDLMQQTANIHSSVIKCFGNFSFIRLSKQLIQIRFVISLSFAVAITTSREFHQRLNSDALLGGARETKIYNFNFCHGFNLSLFIYSNHVRFSC